MNILCRFHFVTNIRSREAGSIFVPRALACNSAKHKTKMANMAEGSEEVYEAALNSNESTQDKRSGKKARRKRNRQGCSKRIGKGAPRASPDIGISEKAMKILDTFVHGLYEQLAVEASRVARSHRRNSLTSRDIETSVRVVLPEGLARRAMDRANLTVANISN